MATNETFIQKIIKTFNIKNKNKQYQIDTPYDKNFNVLKTYKDIISGFFTRNFISKQNSHFRRINLYYDYDYLIYKIPEVSKQVKIITSYILKPDILENEPIVFNQSENNIYTDLAKKFLDFIEIKKYLKQIVYNFLVYGDSYIKVDYLKVSFSNPVTIEEIKQIYEEQLKYKHIYNENSLKVVLEQKFNYNKKKIIEMKQIQSVKKLYFDDNKISESNFEQSEFSILNEDQIITKPVVTNKIVEEIYLPYKITVLSPYNVIKLQEYGINGYLVLPKNLVESTYLFSRIDDTYKRLIGQYSDAYKISEKFQEYLKENNIDQNTIMSLIMEDNDEIVFYPSSSGVIFNFCNIEDPSLLPYGTSILKEQREIQFFIFLIEMQLLIYKINRQTSRRIIQIPIDGVPPEQISEYVETIKQKLKNEITIDFGGDLRQIPQILSILDDYYIPVDNGTPLFSIELLQGDSAQQEQFQNELNYFNRKIVTSLQIPYQYVTFGEERQVNTKLLQEDEHFSRLVDEYQQLIEVTLNEMVCNFLYKVNKEIYYEPNLIKLARPVFFNKLLYYEIQNQKIEYQAKLRELIPNLPTDYILSEILDFPQSEINKIKKYIEKNEVLNQSTEETEI